MLKDITIGQFLPGNSFLHKLDPRVKIIITILFIVLLFLAKGFLSYAIVTVVVVGSVLLSKVPFKMIYKSVKPIAFIVLFTTVLNIFYTPGDPLVTFHIFSFAINITKEGIVFAIAMVLRIVYLIVYTSLLTYTTSPILLTDGIEKLLSPLKKIHVPVHEFAMMMTIALRFIPTLIEETDKIINAQKARGADFETGSLIKRAKALIPILIPLFVSAFRRADELALAMECRCYRGGVGRTRLKQYKLMPRDYISGIVFVLLIVAIVFTNKVSLFAL
ncbi:MAG: energy-coupling factor transporter transmembrane component T [Clostridia bacterium]